MEIKTLGIRYVNRKELYKTVRQVSARFCILLYGSAFLLVSCGENSASKAITETPDPNVTQVLYFHGKQRCATCTTIERLTKEVVDSLDSDKIVMKVVDISQKENQAIADKYEIAWSSLIIESGDKAENLTDMGFGYAMNRPQIFKEKLVKVISKIAE